MPANAVVLTRSAKADLIGLAVDEEIVDGVVARGAVAAVVVVRSERYREPIVDIGSEQV